MFYVMWYPVTLKPTGIQTRDLQSLNDSAWLFTELNLSDTSGFLGSIMSDSRIL